MNTKTFIVILMCAALINAISEDEIKSHTEDFN